jgi:hypothetical protein
VAINNANAKAIALPSNTISIQTRFLFITARLLPGQ